MGCCQSCDLGRQQRYTIDAKHNKDLEEAHNEDETTKGVYVKYTVHVYSRLPIDATQIFKLKQSWKGVRRQIQEPGIEMFIRYVQFLL